MSVRGSILSNWRWYVLAGLLLAPVLFLIAMGAWHLWVEGLWFYVWWPMAACIALTYLLGWYWQRKQRLLAMPTAPPPLHWTERDRRAYQLVEARAKAATAVPPGQLFTLQFYVDTAQEMALELARFYHPTATDPIGKLTVPEILAVVELAAHDLALMVDQYVPGGHLLTIDQWKSAGNIPKWYERGAAIWWGASSLIAPVNTAIRYIASRIGISKPFQMLQENVVAWFYTAFVHQLGSYLIDLNSGRLRVGARRYQELLAEAHGLERGAKSEEQKVAEVVITVLGQVKAGKSSLVNAILGQQRAAADVLPLTNQITRYQLEPTGLGSRLIFLDTVGYSHEGARADQRDATLDALQKSDLALLVLHARDPARKPDVELLRTVREWFAAKPDLKLPPVFGVLTHIDLLSPVMEWSPPYDFVQGTRPKEVSIREAAATAEEQFADHLVGVVPVCTAEGRVYGVQEWVLPRSVERLDEARAVAMLRCLRSEADARRIRRVFEQLLAAGRQLVKAAWEG